MVRLRLNRRYDFVGHLPDGDKEWKPVLWGTRFVLLNDDHPPRVVATEEIEERREPTKADEPPPADGA